MKKRSSQQLISATQKLLTSPLKMLDKLDQKTNQLIQYLKNSQKSKRKVKLLYRSDEIQNKIIQLSNAIRNFYDKKDEIVVLINLKGAFFFAADLLKHFDDYTSMKIEFVQTSSYGSRMTSSGKVDMFILPSKFAIENKKILIIDDIVDTGMTVSTLKEKCLMFHPKDMRVCSLIVRSTLDEEYYPDFYGFLLKEDKFIFGYGLDYDEKMRTSNNIWYVEKGD